MFRVAHRSEAVARETESVAPGSPEVELQHFLPPPLARHRRPHVTICPAAQTAADVAARATQTRGIEDDDDNENLMVLDFLVSV